MSAEDMTRDAGASRTFRSIFHQELQEDELRIHVNRDESGMDDDDALWSDDAAPKARGGSCSDGFEDAGEDGDGEQQHGEEDNNLNDTMLIMDDDDDAADDEGADAPRSDELRIPHRRSMEEWADDDDEEDTWKDMLQAKVNQLELVIQQNSNNHMDTATATNTNSTINGETAANADAESACIAGRPANRHKIQRTSTLHSHAAMMAGSQLHPHKHALSGVTMSPTTNYLRKRSGSTSSCSSTSASRSAKPQDAKKTGATTAAFTTRGRGAKARPSSTSSIAGLTRSSSSTKATHRKSSLDASTGSSIHSSSHNVRRRQSNLSYDTRIVAATASSISEAESVRRYMLQDIKQMSMDRLVNDAKRLLFLEKLFQQQQQPAETPSEMMAATDTPVSLH